MTRRVRTTVYTIGHSNRTLDEFVAALQAHRIDMLIDVRSHPGSRAQPQFGSERLAASLRTHGIRYEHVRVLGGRRRRDGSTDEAVNGAWENESFHAYADYALTSPFREALDDLVANARVSRCAIACAEAVWWRCHRRIVADHLLARNVAVIHIFDATKSEPATLSPHARVDHDGVVTYPSLLP